MRCYDLTSDVPTSQTFHELRERMGPAMTLTNLKTGTIFAAYAMHSWDRAASYTYGVRNVLYSFNEKTHMSSTTQSNNGQYNSPSYGPTFGGGHDMCFYSDMKKLAYCNKHSFAGPLNAQQLCAGGGEVEQLEVYTLGFAATSTAADW